MRISDLSRSNAAGARAVLREAFARPQEAALMDALRRDGDMAIGLVSTAGSEAIGAALFSPLGAPLRALALAPVAVAMANRRRGVAAALIREGIGRARAAGWEAVFVLGDPAYYGRFGFSAGAAAGFECAYAGPHLMMLPLGSADLPTAGRLTYAPAFAELA